MIKVLVSLGLILFCGYGYGYGAGGSGAGGSGGTGGSGAGGSGQNFVSNWQATNARRRAIQQTDRLCPTCKGKDREMAIRCYSKGCSQKDWDRLNEIITTGKNQQTTSRTPANARQNAETISTSTTAETQADTSSSLLPKNSWHSLTPEQKRSQLWKKANSRDQNKLLLFNISGSAECQRLAREANGFETQRLAYLRNDNRTVAGKFQSLVITRQVKLADKCDRTNGIIVNKNIVPQDVAFNIILQNIRILQKQAEFPGQDHSLRSIPEPNREQAEAPRTPTNTESEEEVAENEQEEGTTNNNNEANSVNQQACVNAASNAARQVVTSSKLQEQYSAQQRTAQQHTQEANRLLEQANEICKKEEIANIAINIQRAQDQHLQNIQAPIIHVSASADGVVTTQSTAPAFANAPMIQVASTAENDCNSATQAANRQAQLAAQSTARAEHLKGQGQASNNEVLALGVQASVACGVNLSDINQLDINQVISRLQPQNPQSTGGSKSAQ